MPCTNLALSIICERRSIKRCTSSIYEQKNPYLFFPLKRSFYPVSWSWMYFNNRFKKNKNLWACSVLGVSPDILLYFLVQHLSQILSYTAEVRTRLYNSKYYIHRGKKPNLPHLQKWTYKSSSLSSLPHAKTLVPLCSVAQRTPPSSPLFGSEFLPLFPVCQDNV